MKRKIADVWLVTLLGSVLLALVYSICKAIWESSEHWFWIGLILGISMTIWSIAQIEEY